MVCNVHIDMMKMLSNIATCKSIFQRKPLLFNVACLLRHNPHKTHSKLLPIHAPYNYECICSNQPITCPKIH